MIERSATNFVIEVFLPGETEPTDLAGYAAYLVNAIITTGRSVQQTDLLVIDHPVADVDAVD